MNKALLAALLLCTSCASVPGTWVLNNEASALNFVSTKANTAAEVHRFTVLEGTVDLSGSVHLSIDLNSVDTAIDIRDERMRDLLFETKQYPNAVLKGQVNIDEVLASAIGSETRTATEATLSLHGTEITVQAELSAVRLSANRLLVISDKPLIVNAADAGLLEGIEKLRAIAGLPSISPAVPVTFSFVFDLQR